MLYVTAVDAGFVGTPATCCSRSGSTDARAYTRLGFLGRNHLGNKAMRTRLCLALGAALAVQIASAQRAQLTFAALDTDKNNSLSKEEIATWVKTIPAGGPNGPPNADDVFGRWDANKDGSVSQAEFDARPRPAGPGGPPGAGGPPPAR